jgi:hypothetical protein
VRDISGQGAKLKVSDSIAIPEFVELYIPNKDETYRAKVQWRTGFEIGVTFENDQEAPSIVRAPRRPTCRNACGGWSRGRLAASQAQRAAERAAPRAGLGNLGALIAYGHLLVSPD